MVGEKHVNWPAGRVSALYVGFALLIAVIGGFFTFPELRRRWDIDRERTELLTLRLAGKTVQTQFIMASGDTSTLGKTKGMWTLLYAMHRECNACDQMSETLLEHLAAVQNIPLELWITGGSSADQLTDLRRLNLTVRDVHAVDEDQFRSEFNLEHVPYLALVDDAAVVQRAQVGFWRKKELQWIDTLLVRMGTGH